MESTNNNKKLESKIKYLNEMLHEADNKIDEMEITLKQEKQIYTELLKSFNNNVNKLDQKQEIINSLEMKLFENTTTVTSTIPKKKMKDISCGNDDIIVQENMIENNNIINKLKLTEYDNILYKERIIKLEIENESNILLKNEIIHYKKLLPSLENKILDLEKLNIKLENDILNISFDINNENIIKKNLSLKDEILEYDINSYKKNIDELSNIKISLSKEIIKLTKMKDLLFKEINDLKQSKDIYINIPRKDIYSPLISYDKNVNKNKNKCCFL